MNLAPVFAAVAIGVGLFFLSFILLRILVAALIIRGAIAVISRHRRLGGGQQHRFHQPAMGRGLTLRREVEID